MKKKFEEALRGMVVGTCIGVLLGLLFPKQAVALYRAERRLIRSVMEWIKAVYNHGHTGTTHIESRKISEDEVPEDIKDALAKMAKECPNIVSLEDL